VPHSAYFQYRETPPNVLFSFGLSDFFEAHGAFRKLNGTFRKSNASIVASASRPSFSAAGLIAPSERSRGMLALAHGTPFDYLRWHLAWLILCKKGEPCL